MPRGPNPFRPGFGVSPRVLAGRGDLIAEFETALDEGPGSPLRSVLVSGTRGMGKTVILNELEELARVRGWLVIRLPESGGLVEDLVETTLPTLLSEHDSARAVRRRVTGGGVSGLGSVTTSATERYPVRESAETLLTRLLDVLTQHGTGVLLTLDEIQAVDRDELAAFAAIYQHLIRDEREVAFAAAGLPVGVDRLLQHRGTTFLRRAERIHLPSLTRTEVTEAARRTIEDADGPSATSDLAARLGVNMQHQNVYRTRLIERELITPAGHGFVDFALPYLREHVRRHSRGSGSRHPRLGAPLRCRLRRGGRAGDLSTGTRGHLRTPRRTAGPVRRGLGQAPACPRRGRSDAACHLGMSGRVSVRLHRRAVRDGRPPAAVPNGVTHPA